MSKEAIHSLDQPGVRAQCYDVEPFHEDSHVVHHVPPVAEPTMVMVNFGSKHELVRRFFRSKFENQVFKRSSSNKRVSWVVPFHAIGHYAVHVHLEMIDAAVFDSHRDSYVKQFGFCPSDLVRVVRRRMKATNELMHRSMSGLSDALAKGSLSAEDDIAVEAVYGFTAR